MTAVDFREWMDQHCLGKSFADGEQSVNGPTPPGC
jgi:hypothetical protein